MMSIESKEKSNDSYHCQQISIDGKDAKNLGDLVGQVLSHFLVFHFLTPQGPADIMIAGDLQRTTLHLQRTTFQLKPPTNT